MKLPFQIAAGLLTLAFSALATADDATVLDSIDNSNRAEANRERDGARSRTDQSVDHDHIVEIAEGS